MTIPDQIKAAEERHVQFAIAHPAAYERWANKRQGKFIKVSTIVTPFGILKTVGHPLFFNTRKLVMR